MKVREARPFYAPFRASSSRVKRFNGDRTSRVDGLLRADLPNRHTTPAIPPDSRANHLPFLLVIPPPPPMGRALLLALALRTRAHSDPPHWFLCHMSEYEYEFGRCEVGGSPAPKAVLFKLLLLLRPRVSKKAPRGSSLSWVFLLIASTIPPRGAKKAHGGEWK